MTFQDYYKILGIDKSATQKDIKTAYRRLARKYHPDLNPNDKDAKKNFQQINEANEVLSDPEKRKKYDQYGKDWEHAAESGQYQNQSANPQGQRSNGPQSETDFSDFFASMFGNDERFSRGRQVKYRGEDYSTELQLSLKDAYATHPQMLNVNGKSIRINIPAGIENGQTIKIAGYGGPGINGGPNGDLFITFTVDNDRNFKRLGNNLYTTVDLDLYTAVLGGEITVNTFNGKVKLKVPAETQNGTKIKLQGKGFPVYKKEGQFGDLYITYSIVIPKNLTEKQKTLFKEISNLQFVKQ